MSRPVSTIIAISLLLASPFTAADSKLSFEELVDFGNRYAAAWSSQDPERLAAFYAPDGTLQVNDGEPAVGREAIAEKVRGFMEAFPDMVVEMRAMQGWSDGAEFHWRWTGTNTGPGGTGRSVALTGYEEWTFNAEGLIQESKGHYDEDLYEAQVNGTSSE